MKTKVKNSIEEMSPLTGFDLFPTIDTKLEKKKEEKQVLLEQNLNVQESILKFQTINLKTPIIPKNIPEPRLLYSIIQADTFIIIFGGQLQNNTYLNDLYFYDILY
jgi:hypothetical protein